MLGLRPLRMEQSCRRDVAGEKRGGWRAACHRQGAQAEFRWGGSSIWSFPAISDPFPPQSLCGDCVQRQTAHPAALLQKGEKGDQGIPGVPGLDNCARVRGWAKGQPWYRESPWWPHLTEPLIVPHSAS